MKKLLALFLITIAATPLLGQNMANIERVGPFSDGLAAIEKNGSWAFIDSKGALKIDFRSDIYLSEDQDYPVFKNGRCKIFKTVEDGIKVYGFIDKMGNTVVAPNYLTLSDFEKGYATGVYFEKIKRGQNEFKLDIYEFKFHDVLLDDSGNIVEFFGRRYGIQMTKKRYKQPKLHTKLLSEGLIAHWTKDGKWEIKKIVL